MGAPGPSCYALRVGWRAIPPRAIALAFVVGLPLGCAAITGVDQFQKGECAGGCDGGGDATVDVPVADSPAPDGSPADTGADGADGAMSGGDADAGSATDAADASDAPVGDCGALNTVQNCTMCGAACDTAHSNDASCNGSTCLYASCKGGWSNCATNAPDLAGCECNTPSCCGSACQTTHMNGVGQNFYDCVAQNTYNASQAFEACGAYTGNQNTCSQAGCVDSGDMVVCGTANSKCTCWEYTGTQQGHLYQSNDGTCYCPGGGNPSWN